MDPSKFAPIENPDSEAFWQSLLDGKLSIQRCGECGTHRHPPSPVCHACQSFEREWIASSGRGRVWTFAIVREPLEGWPGDVPNVVAIVEMEEGIKLVSRIVGSGAEEVQIGDEVQVEIGPGPAGIMLPHFQLIQVPEV